MEEELKKIMSIYNDYGINFQMVLDVDATPDYMKVTVCWSNVDYDKTPIVRVYPNEPVPIPLIANCEIIKRCLDTFKREIEDKRIQELNGGIMPDCPEWWEAECDYPEEKIEEMAWPKVKKRGNGTHKEGAYEVLDFLGIEPDEWIPVYMGDYKFYLARENKIED